MTSSTRPEASRRYVLLLILSVLASGYLSRASLLSAQAKGRPTVVPERLVAAVIGPGQRAAYRAARGLRELAGALAFPRAYSREAADFAVAADDCRQASEALRAYTAEYESESMPLGSDAAPLERCIRSGLEATVIGADPTGRRRLLLLDAGVVHGVERGMGVVVGPDLIGRVERVNRSSTVAHLCTDREFWVPVRCMRSGDYLGTLVGDGGNGMHVYGLPVDSDVREGDSLTTAPSRDGPPPELRVGVVEAVTLITEPRTVEGADDSRDRAGLLVIYARPATDLETAAKVQIVPGVSYGG
jgi:cell shape-determining protein MreC